MSVSKDTPKVFEVNSDSNQVAKLPVDSQESLEIGQSQISDAMQSQITDKLASDPQIGQVNAPKYSLGQANENLAKLE